jgi:hypothetical protein
MQLDVELRLQQHAEGGADECLIVDQQNDDRRLTVWLRGTGV